MLEDIPYPASKGEVQRLSLTFGCRSTKATLLLRQEVALWYLKLSLSLLGVTDTHVFGMQVTGKENKYQLRYKRQVSMCESHSESQSGYEMLFPCSSAY